DLPTLRTRMNEITNRVHLIHTDKDEAIPLQWAEEVEGWLPTAQLDTLTGLGHLAHEEAPERVHDAIMAFARAQDAKEAG
ncbi:MAG: alpha/beta hydrolase, partial [Pseudomonadota bacterium]